MVDERKKRIVKLGTKLAFVIETICALHIDGAALDYLKLHRRCKDWNDHPDWDTYEDIVLRCEKIMDVPIF
jgi:hypothetical protein